MSNPSYSYPIKTGTSAQFSVLADGNAITVGKQPDPNVLAVFDGTLAWHPASKLPFGLPASWGDVLVLWIDPDLVADQQIRTPSDLPLIQVCIYGGIGKASVRTALQKLLQPLNAKATQHLAKQAKIAATSSNLKDKILDAFFRTNANPLSIPVKAGQIIGTLSQPLLRLQLLSDALNTVPTLPYFQKYWPQIENWDQPSAIMRKHLMFGAGKKWPDGSDLYLRFSISEQKIKRRLPPAGTKVVLVDNDRNPISGFSWALPSNGEITIKGIKTGGKRYFIALQFPATSFDGYTLPDRLAMYYFFINEIERRSVAGTLGLGQPGKPLALELMMKPFRLKLAKTVNHRLVSFPGGVVSLQANFPAGKKYPLSFKLDASGVGSIGITTDSDTKYQFQQLAWKGKKVDLSKLPNFDGESNIELGSGSVPTYYTLDQYRYFFRLLIPAPEGSKAIPLADHPIDVWHGPEKLDQKKLQKLNTNDPATSNRFGDVTLANVLKANETAIPATNSIAFSVDLQHTKLPSVALLGRWEAWKLHTEDRVIYAPLKDVKNHDSLAIARISAPLAFTIPLNYFRVVFETTVAGKKLPLNGFKVKLQEHTQSGSTKTTKTIRELFTNERGFVALGLASNTKSTGKVSYSFQLQPGSFQYGSQTISISKPIDTAQWKDNTHQQQSTFSYAVKSKSTTPKNPYTFSYPVTSFFLHFVLRHATAGSTHGLANLEVLAYTQKAGATAATQVGRGVTDANGKIQFHLPDFGTNERFHGWPIWFEIKTKGQSLHGHPAIPADWSTRKWIPASGYAAPNNAPTTDPLARITKRTYGSAAKPYQFLVGAHLEGRMEFEDKTRGNNVYSPLPPGLEVSFVKEGQTNVIGTAVTLRNPPGRVKAVLFGISPGDRITAMLKGELQPFSGASNTELSKSYYHKMDTSQDADPNKRIGPVYGAIPTLVRSGTITVPSVQNFRLLANQPFRFRNNTWGGSVMIHGLKLFSEVMLWINHFAAPNGVKTWEKTVNGKKYVITIGFDQFWANGVASKENWTVRLSSKAHWNRHIIAHELGHIIQFVMNQITLEKHSNYKQTHTTSNAVHYKHVQTDGATALSEGWADFMPIVFTDQLSGASDTVLITPNTVIRMRGEKRSALKNGPPKLGLTVEGVMTAFAGNIYRQAIKDVLGKVPTKAIYPSPHADPTLHPATQISGTQSYLLDARVAKRFRELFWEHFSALANTTAVLNGKTVPVLPEFEDLIKNMQSSAQWAAIKPHLKDWNVGI